MRFLSIQFLLCFFFQLMSNASENIPNLVGTWVGINKPYQKTEDTDLGKKS